MSYQIGIDLGDATVRKFNEISERVGVNVLIHGDRVWDRKI